MLYAFDLDGTLFDTKPIVLQAYRSAGVEPPEDWFGKSWREWLPAMCASSENAERIHKIKNKHYAAIIHTVRRLPLFDLFCKLVECSNTLVDYTRAEVVVLTGASSEAVNLLWDFYAIPRGVAVFTELSVNSKIVWMSRSAMPGIMFEDDIVAAQQMRKETKWTIFHSPQ